MFYLSAQTLSPAPKSASRSILLFIMTAVLLSIVNIVQASEVSQDGQLLFKKHCAVCHGSEGSGGVGVPLNMDDFLNTTSNHYLQQTIRLGRPGRIMPAFSTLSDKQVDNIIHYIRSWKPKIKAPVYSQQAINGDIKKGQAI
ncbi:MAG: cytochrome c [gamma proteobacterium symbiont of Lucinoma myriamae]|nr:cytochrome c [gamma proteobacterium symbiont of Lucinoma myriamae]